MTEQERQELDRLLGEFWQESRWPVGPENFIKVKDAIHAFVSRVAAQGEGQRHDKEGWITIRKDVCDRLRERSHRLESLESSDEVGWLIEVQRDGITEWWKGSEWTTDSLLAVRFAREIDAIRVLHGQAISFFGTNAKPSEHMWVGPPAVPPDVPEGER